MNYKKILTNSILDAYKFASITLIISIIVMSIIFGVNITKGTFVTNTIDSFNKFEVNINMTTNNEIILFKSPKISIDTENKELNDRNIVITNDGIIYKKFYFFGMDKLDYPNDGNILNQPQTKTVLTLILFLLFPGIILFTLIFFGISYIILSLISTSLLLLFHRKRSFSDYYKLSIYALTPMILLHIIFLPTTTMLITPIIIYIVWISLAIFFLGDVVLPSMKKSEVKKIKTKTEKNKSSKNKINKKDKKISQAKEEEEENDNDNNDELEENELTDDDIIEEQSVIDDVKESNNEEEFISLKRKSKTKK